MLVTVQGKNIFYLNSCSLSAIIIKNVSAFIFINVSALPKKIN
ncbi:hypothetical protein PFLA_b1250 [Pseudoalteromonas flavipulchra NCIMB 2033 = ATCC BAA-314]|nr:hypothetical protein [Pseudoalteromonas flavipulchra NCIMB 2033 = ATCC BAA-314]